MISEREKARQVMEFVTSDNAAALLFREGKVDYAEKLDLAELARKLVERLGESKLIAVALLREASGFQTVGEILDSLGNFLPFDSTVRDVATTGHLGKLLSRKTIYESLSDWRVVGLPHSLFDRLSWKERNEVFKEGVCHVTHPDLLRNRAVLEMLDREESLMRREN